MRRLLGGSMPRAATRARCPRSSRRSTPRGPWSRSAALYGRWSAATGPPSRPRSSPMSNDRTERTPAALQAVAADSLRYHLPPVSAVPEMPAPLERALRQLQAGGMVIVCDDPDRENEGDLCMAAEFVTAKAVTF